MADRLTYAAEQGRRKQNCATAALGYVASELGKPIPSDVLGTLVGPDGKTTMYQMKQLAQGQGLFCRGVRTDLNGLRTLSGVKAILHIPGKDHFVVLDCVDGREVRLIDLSKDRFYYRTSVDFFPLEWSQGAALLLGMRAIDAPFEPLDDATLAATVGGEGYDCTLLIQEWACIYCDPEECQNYFHYRWERYGCDYAFYGTCQWDLLVSSQEDKCHARELGGCEIHGEWTFYNLLACK